MQTKNSKMKKKIAFMLVTLAFGNTIFGSGLNAADRSGSKISASEKENDSDFVGNEKSKETKSNRNALIMAFLGTGFTISGVLAWIKMKGGSHSKKEEVQNKASDAEQIIYGQKVLNISDVAKTIETFNPFLEKYGVENPTKVDRNELGDAFNISRAICEKQPTCIKIPSKYTIYTGDTHGSPEVVGKLLKRLIYLTGRGIDAQIVFTGDYDEGPFPLESMYLMVKAQEIFSGRVFILRGNHDATGCTVIRDDMVDDEDNPYFAWGNNLPLAAFIGTTTASCHGMWPPDLDSEEKLLGLNKADGNDGNCIIYESLLTWGDLCDHTGPPTEERKETGRRTPSGVGSLLSAKALSKFGRRILIKGHNHPQAGDHQEFEYENQEFHFFVAISYAAIKAFAFAGRLKLEDGRHYCVWEQPDPDNKPEELFANNLDDEDFVTKTYIKPEETS
jgi:hypothetical protein